MFPATLLQTIEQSRLAAVLTIEDPADALPVATALCQGGVSVIELTFRTDAAPDAIRRIRDGLPDVTVGAGTLLTARDVATAIAAGAAFGVSPGCNPNTIREARDRSLPFAPGISTPSDIERALELDCRLLKFFPAESSGGLAHLKNIATPYAHLGLKFIPLGGINAGNLVSYARSPWVACIGGSWLAPTSVIQRKDWETVRRNASEALELIRNGT